MIARHWRGVVKPDEAENYIRHLQKETFPQLARIAGFLSASISRRKVERGVEFVVITLWESMEAIQQFAGASTDIAVVPAVAQAMLIEYDLTVAHYEVVEVYQRGALN